LKDRAKFIDGTWHQCLAAALHLLCLFNLSEPVSSLNTTKLTASHSGANGAISMSAIVVGVRIELGEGRSERVSRQKRIRTKSRKKQTEKEMEGRMKKQRSKAPKQRTRGGFMLKTTEYLAGIYCHLDLDDALARLEQVKHTIDR